MLRASNFYESMLHILQLMRIYVDDTVADLKKFKDSKYKYSPYVRGFMKSAWAAMAQCVSCNQVSDTTYEVVQQCPEYQGGKGGTVYTLPSYSQLHVVNFPTNNSHPTCSCPEYTQGLRICAGMCAALQRQGRGAEHTDVALLHPLWHISNHPLMSLVNDSTVAYQGAAQTISNRPVFTPQTIAPNDVLRLATLHAAFNDVVQHSLKTPFFEELHHALLQHKQKVLGQSLEFPPAFAPQSSILPIHANRGGVPEQEVVNKSRLTAYRPSSKGRVETATSLNPTAYNLHKRALAGDQVTCDCGGTLTNNKRSRYWL